MTEDMRHSGEPWGPRFKFVLIGFALIGGFFLIVEHRAHVLPYLPWLILAACPLLHMFMHGGHGDGGHQGHGGDTPASEDPAKRSSAGQSSSGDAAGKGSPGTGASKAATPSAHSHHQGGGS
jgi:hypothetical protein